MAKNTQTENNFQDEEDEIITLRSETGEDVDFIDIARISYKNNRYAIMQPVKLLAGMGEDDAFIFKITESQNEEGDEDFAFVFDQEILDGVYAEYNKLYDEMLKNENSQGEGKINGRK